ncbi:MAG: hypothetical protein AABY32_01485 [Nanoarchaeota archaeon]
MSKKTKEYSVSIDFCGLLCLLFIALKLTNYIDWSWIWVLAPIWIPITIVLSITAMFFGVMGIVIFFVYLTEVIANNKRNK